MKFTRCFQFFVSSALLLVFPSAYAQAINPFGAGPKNVTPVVDDISNTIGIIVKYKSGQVAAQNLTKAVPGEDVASLGLSKVSASAARHGAKVTFRRTLATGGHLLNLDKQIPKSKMDAIINEIRLDPAVEYVELDAVMQHQLVPNDSSYATSQWHYFEPTGGINLPPAWDVSTGVGVKVAVLDTGTTNHPDLNTNMVGGYDFISNTFMSNDGNGRDANRTDPGDGLLVNTCITPSGGQKNSTWHGTHVAGTIAALTNNGTGVAGVAYGAKVVPIRVLGRCGGLLNDIAEAIIWAAGGTVAGVPTNSNPAKIINMSLGGLGSCGPTYTAAINQARALGALIVVAAGNDNQDASLTRPANCAGVLSVAATTRYGSKASFSNFGASVGIAAPGEAVYSTLNTGLLSPGASSYAAYSGTSMATPHVSGVAALVWSKNPTFTADQVITRLKTTSRPFPGACNLCGTGIVNAAAALGLVSNPSVGIDNISPLLDLLLFD